MFNPGLIKARRSTTDAAPYTIAKYGAVDYEVALATAVTDKFAGVYTEVGAKTGRVYDVVMDGMPGVKLGGPVTAGAKLTTNASGQAVAAAATNNVVGTAVAAGVAGDIIPVQLALGTTA